MIKSFIEYLELNTLPKWKLQVGENSVLEKPGKYKFISEYEKEQFYSNLKTKQDLLKYYLENPLEYTLNSDGFRSDEFMDGDEVTLFLGCSDTFGLGLHQEHTWSYKLHKALDDGTKYYNLALPGNDIQTDFRTLYYILKKYKLKVKNIFHFAAKRVRYEIFIPRENKIEMISIHTIDKKIQDRLFLNHIIDETRLSVHFISMVYAINKIADDLGAKYFVANFDFIGDLRIKDTQNFNILYDWSLKSLKARDLEHPNYFENHKIFSVFYDMIKEKEKEKFI